MTINKRATAKAVQAGEKFIAKAEGGGHAQRWVRGNRTQFTVSMAPDLLRRLDDAARRKNVSRSAFLAFCIDDWLAEHEREAA
jgi:hypothetical protein